MWAAAARSFVATPRESCEGHTRAGASLARPRVVACDVRDRRYAVGVALRSWVFSEAVRRGAGAPS